MKEKRCSAPTWLATSEVARVHRCGCGEVYVHVGPASLRFDEAAFMAFVDTVVEARRAFAHDPCESALLMRLLGARGGPEA